MPPPFSFGFALLLPVLERFGVSALGFFEVRRFSPACAIHLLLPAGCVRPHLNSAALEFGVRGNVGMGVRDRSATDATAPRTTATPHTFGGTAVRGGSRS